MMKRFLAALVIGLCGCAGKEQTLFKLLDSDEHGIAFENTIAENDTLNILQLEYIYNGGAVAVGDFNNDGLSDLYFSGNIVPDKLYINKGNLRFQDVTEAAGITPNNRWRAGVALVDINSDGLLDIYVCTTIKKDSSLRANILYVNQGLDANGVPKFADQAPAYGIADTGHDENAAFFDYDNDGDLDLYIITNTIQKGIPTSYRPKMNDGSPPNADRLYRNNGNGTFTDVSKVAGIVHEGYGLGLAIADINQDGWQDVYVSNDYITNDLMYLNNGDGTFTNAIDAHIRHQSQFSMGNDIADFNNDALPDIITLDMLPERNLRRKTVIGGPGYISYINNDHYGYAHQYVRNMVQLNNGDGTFSEIGQMLGLHQTEWSWSPLFADFDNDGLRDVVITNGFPRDITDRDFSNFRSGPGGNLATPALLLDSVPVVKISNYAFKNKGDLAFADVSQAWGIDQPSFSNGAAFADLDNDGDLDYVVNNINDKVFLYENTLNPASASSGKSHYLRVRLKGKEGNLEGLGTKVTLRYGNGKKQYHDHSLYRGYLSTVEGVIHFGLGEYAQVDSVLVEWPGKRSQLLLAVKADQVLEVSYANSANATVPESGGNSRVLLQQVSYAAGLKFRHEEQDFIDFNVQRTIPHKFSQSGPGIAVGDITGDGLEDFVTGGSSKHDATLFTQMADGTFAASAIPKSTAGLEEDQGLLLFDADNDADLDLYAVSGGFEFPENHAAYRDRFYRNERGKFVVDTMAIPRQTSNGSCVRAADFDGDGDLDLFVGGSVVPGKYPFASRSYVLRNDRGVFSDVTEIASPALQGIGMIRDALLTDFNNDGRTDLLIAGEFMPITLFQNTGRGLEQVKDSGLEKYSGWWNSLAGGDFDRDGDMDYVAGNLGTNNYYGASPTFPLHVYAKDFDGNSSVDAILSCYFKSEDGIMREFPAHFWEELNAQSPKFRRKFAYYREYGRATMNSLLTPDDLKEALVLETNHTASSYIENLGNGKFKLSPLPVEAQMAPIHGMVTSDVNGDGFLDVLMVGNDYGNEVFSGRYDAFGGLVLLGDGQGGFRSLRSLQSGFVVPGDARAVVSLSWRGSTAYIASQNRDSLRMFAPLVEKRFEFTPDPYETYGVLTFNDGSQQRIEFYYGTGYLAQSSRKIRLPKDVKELTVYDSRGKPRTITPSSM